MNPKSTRIWIIVAAALLAFIFIHQRYARKPSTGPIRPLPDLKAAEITGLLVRLQGQPQIHVQFTNQTWQLIEPIGDLANARAIERLLLACEKLTAASRIPAAELLGHTNLDGEYGFNPEQISISLQQGGQKLPQLKLGRKTNPGDQIFAQVAGDQGVYLLDAALLDLLPRTLDAWREPSVINLNKLPFDRVGITKSGASIMLERDTNRVWRMVSPLLSRADNLRIHEGLVKIHSLRIGEFVPETPKPELETLGLAPPELTVGFYEGTNSTASIQFGKTNATGQVYARRPGRNAVFTVPADSVAAWQQGGVNDFRDRHLLALPPTVAGFEIRGQDLFKLQRQTNSAWRVLPQNFPADAGLVGELLSNLTNMPIADFESEVATDLKLPAYGLAAPLRRYLVFAPAYWVGASNAVLADVSFGMNEGKVYARRADEAVPFAPIYVINTNDFARLPSASWQLRERRIWNISTNDIAGVSIRDLGKTRRIIRREAYKWSPAPGSVGIINGLAMEETVRDLADVEAVGWVGRGATNRARFGFADAGHQVSIEVKGGDPSVIEFGGQAPSGSQYAAVMLDGDLWIFEFPLSLYRHVRAYLTIPQDVP